MGNIEEKPREITFFGTNPERLSLIANKYTLRISSRPYESAVEEKEVKINEVVTASNFVSSIIPNFLNRLPQYKRNRMSLEQVLVYCEKELKQQSKLSNIMEITIKRDGLEQTVGEYVRYMIETRYNRLAG